MLSKKLIPLVLAVFAMGLGACGSTTPSNTTSTPVGPGESSSEPAPTPTETYTVTFYHDGAVWGTPATVAEGEKVAKPTDPTKEGDEFVTYAFSGWYEAGQETAFDFETPITKDLNLYSEFTKNVRDDYDLVVFVYGINGASEPTTYITEEESNFMRDTFKSTLSEEANILWHYVAGKKNNAFNEYVVNSDLPVDLVISGNKLDNDETSIGKHETYGKVHLGNGWIENTSRYLTITSYCPEAHLELALKAYNLLSGLGPKYKITLDVTNTTLEIGDTTQLTATYYGTTVEWTTSAASVATVSETGLVTAVAAGEATITAKDGQGNEATCLVTVSAAPVIPEHDLVIVLNNSNASNLWMDVEDAEYLVEAFTATGAPGEGKDVELHIVSGVNIAGVVSAIEEINTNPLAKADAFLCRSAFFTNSATKGLFDTETLANVHKSWGYDGGQYAIATDAFEEHIELATAFSAFVANTHVDYFEMDSSVSVKIGETYQLPTVEGATYTSSKTDVVTVSATGLITAVAEGSAYIEVVKGKYVAEVAVTVKPAEVVPCEVTILIHTSASSTTYVDEAALQAIKDTVASTVDESVTVSYIIVSGKKNAGVTTALDEAEHVSMSISAKASIQDSTLTVAEDAPITKCNAKFAASGESRYTCVFAGLSNAEHAASLAIYRALIA